MLADLFISLDGFAAGEDVGPYFELGGPELDAFIEGQLALPQQVVLGRRTYEALSAISMRSDDPGSRRLATIPKLVVSNTLHEPLAWPNTRLVSGDGLEALAALEREAAVPMRTMGSISLVHSLIRGGLVDRLRLTFFPIVLGARGREPVFAGMGEQRLVLDRTRVLDRRILCLTYRTPPA
jgi:dihydrofolate reductase